MKSGLCVFIVAGEFILGKKFYILLNDLESDARVSPDILILLFH